MRLLASALLALLVIPVALAHTPQVAPEDRVIEEPDRSWAFYDVLPPGGSHAWTFELSAGEPLFLSISVPTGATSSPDASLAGPEGPIALERVDAIELEPFTPYASRRVWAINTGAPADGLYVLTISGESGPYAFGYGLAEVFTPVEWATIPIEVMRIHAWAGRSALWLALPYVAGLLLLALPRTRAATPAPLLPRLAAGLFLGSGLDRLLQLGIALAAGAQADAAAWGIAASLALPSFALAWVALLARHPLSFIAIGLAALALWAGLLLGPAFAIAAGLARAAETGRIAMRRREPRAGA